MKTSSSPIDGEDLSSSIPSLILLNHTPDHISKDEYEQIIAEDMKLYAKYFDSIRDHIIKNLDYTYSTASLIEALESYRIQGEHKPQRLRQVVEIYNYCLTHPNDIAFNDDDFILGVLLASSFEYETFNYIPDSRTYDRFVVVDKFLNENELDAYGASGGGYKIIYVSNIEKALNLLAPEFDYPQPPFHSLPLNYNIEALERLPHVPLHSRKSTKLIQYVRKGYFKKVKHLVEECGVNVNAQDEMGNTPLLEAISNNRGGMFEYLLEHGADPNFKSKDDQYPIITATECNRVGMVGILLNHNVDIRVRNADGETPLVIAADNEYVGVLELLVDALRELKREESVDMCEYW